MATLILSTVGTALGGPVGGVIGSMIGQTIDARLLGPGPRHGPRLGDLSIQTSSYGTAIPRIYGTMRVAGSVVWATDLKEAEEPQQGGKGQPETIMYSYSASFAVAVSSRPVRAVKRIWADGKLLRGEAGDFKVQTGFRFYDGSEDQPVDPLIASIEGIGHATAFRGLALAVFEDLQLIEYGNRIPFLTFEIEADEGGVEIGGLLTDCSRGAIASASAERVGGYAAHGQSIAAAVQPLIDQFAVRLFDDGEVVRSADAGDVLQLDEDELGCSADASPGARIERSQVPARDLPSTLSMTYYDPARDYQTGQAQAISGSRGGRVEEVELPAVLEAAQAKGLAEESLARQWAERERLRLNLPPRFMGLLPGSAIELPGKEAAWTVHSVALDSLVTRVEARPCWEAIGTLAAAPGRALKDADLVAGPTMMALLDLPDFGDETGSGPALYLAAASTSGTWRRVPVEVMTRVAGSGDGRCDRAAGGWERVGAVRPGKFAGGHAGP